MKTAKPKRIKRHREVSPEKLTEYARRGRGANAFVPRKTKEHNKLQERIEMVVKKAMKRRGQPDYDVIHRVDAPLRFTNAHKIG